jgi:hypothetical protein
LIQVRCRVCLQLLEAFETPGSTGFGWIDNLSFSAWRTTVDVAFANARLVLPQWSIFYFSSLEPFATFATLFMLPEATSLSNPLQLARLS